MFLFWVPLETSQLLVEEFNLPEIYHNNYIDIDGNGDTDDDNDDDGVDQDGHNVEELFERRENGRKKAIVPKTRNGLE